MKLTETEDGYSYNLYASKDNQESPLMTDISITADEIYETLETGFYDSNAKAYKDNGTVIIEIDGQTKKLTKEDLTATEQNSETVMHGTVLDLNGLNKDETVYNDTIISDIKADDLFSETELQDTKPLSQVIAEIEQLEKEYKDNMKQTVMEAVENDGYYYGENGEKITVDKSNDPAFQLSILSRFKINDCVNDFLPFLQQKWETLGIIGKDTQLSAGDWKAFNSFYSPDGVVSQKILELANGTYHFETPLKYAYDSSVADSKSKVVEIETLKDKYDICMARLRAISPFAYHFIKRCGVIINPNPNATMGVNEKYIEIGLVFFATCSVAEASFVLLHEANHLFRGHLLDGIGKDHRLWNIAGDLIINKNIVVKFGSLETVKGDRVDAVDRYTLGLVPVKLPDSNRPYLFNIDPQVKQGLPSTYLAFSLGGLYSDNVDLEKHTTEILYNNLKTKIEKGEYIQDQGEDQNDVNDDTNEGGEDSGKTQVQDLRKLPPSQIGAWTPPEKSGGMSGGDSVVQLTTELQDIIAMVKRFAMQLDSGIDFNGTPLTIEEKEQIEALLLPLMERLHLSF